MTMIKEKYAVGIDLGGTFVKYALVSDTGEILFDGKLPVGDTASREDTLEVIQDSIQHVVDWAAEKEIKLQGVGLVHPE